MYPEDNQPDIQPQDAAQPQNTQPNQSPAPTYQPGSTFSSSPTAPPSMPSVDTSTPTVSGPAPAPQPSPTIQVPQTITQLSAPNPYEQQPSIPVSKSDAPAPLSPQGRNKKKIALIIAVPVFILLLGAGAVFGLYLPNTPQNVFKTGLSRTGKAVDKLILGATEEAKLKSYLTSEVTGDLTVKSDGNETTVNITSNSDKESTDSTIAASIPSEQGDIKADLSVLTETADGKVYPDIYFKLTGIRELSRLGALPEIEKLFAYDGRWISISNEYLESLANQVGGASLESLSQTSTEDITAADVSSLTRSLVAVTNEYVFTDDKDKAVIIQKEFVGKEEVDGVNTHHYKAGFDKANSTAYCKALTRTIFDSELAKKFFKGAGDDTDINKTKDESIKSCDEDAKDFDDKQTFDMWVESSRKVIHKVRVYETEYKYDDNDIDAEPRKEYSKTRYYEFGQTEAGDNEIKLFIEYFDTEQTDTTNRTELIFNTKSSTVELTGKYADKEDDYDITFKLSIKPSDKAVAITKPGDAVSIQEVLDALGMGSFINDMVAQSRDIERRNELYSIQSKLEEFYSLNGFYPTNLAELNLSEDELTGPNNDAYTYVNNGEAYTLGAQLEDASDPDAVNGVYTLSNTEVTFTDF